MADLREFDLPNFKNSTFRLDRPSSYLLSKARKDHINGYSNLKKSTTSATIYIGKLSFNTTEEQLYELFNKCGKIKKIIMGLDKVKLTPTGFCFIIFEQPQGALAALKYLNKTKINGRQMEIDLDPGFTEGRQFGRAVDGSQKQHVPFNNGGGNFRNNNRNGGYRERRGGYRGGNRDRRGPYNGPHGGSFRERRDTGRERDGFNEGPRRDGTRVWRPSDDPEYYNQPPQSYGGRGSYGSYNQPQQSYEQGSYNNYSNNYSGNNYRGGYHNDNYGGNYPPNNDNYSNNHGNYGNNDYNNNHSGGYQSGNYGRQPSDDSLPPHLANNQYQNSGDLPPHLQ